jgi:D-glutamate N-acetyltransferase
MRRIAILAEGKLNPQDAKTAVGILRYRPDDAVAVIDSIHAGRDAATALGDPSGPGAGVPVVADVAAALPFQPDTLLIGIAPIGGRLPAAWRAQILAAIAAGLDIVSGLHHFLGDDAELSSAAERAGVRIWDVRRPDDALALRIREGQAHRPGSHIVHFCGTDCNVGKMTVAVELDREARRRGLSSGFAATGQTGIMISGEGIPADRFISDFLAGGVEALVLDFASRYDWVFVEGQGSLIHPAYSAVTLGLLHGAAPDLLILCHEAGRAHIRGYDVAIPPLSIVRQMYETAAAWLKPAPVVAVALNTRLLDEASARRALDDAERETGLPAADPVRFGAGPLLDALLAHT